MNGIKVGERGGLTRTLQAAREGIRQHISATKKNRQQLAALNAIFDLITQSLDIQQVLTLTADKTFEVMDVDAVRMYILDEEAKELLLEISRGISEEFVARVRRIKISEGFNGIVAKTGNAMIVEDTATNPLLRREVVVSEGIKSQLIVPLRSGGRVVGTLCVARRTPGKFHTDEVALLSCIGNTLGVALGNACLHQEMNQALTQLRQSEERYRDLFEGAYDAIWVHDLDGNMLAANRACEKLTGYSIGELMEKNVCQIIPESSQTCLDEVEGRLRQNETVDSRCEGEVVRKAGDRAIIQVTTSMIAHEGQPIGFQHCARDVTEERRLQDNLHYYLQQVTRVQEEERKRIARELHDEILQRLIAISRQLEKITSSDALWEESLQTVRSFKKQVEVAVQEIRRFSHDLRPSILDDLGLLSALELLTNDLEQQGIATSFKAIGEGRRLVPEVEVMLFRIAQEAATNIRRHAQASMAELVIEFCDAKVRLSIKDNGSGFDVPQRAEDLASTGKLGLVGIHERTKLLGGSLTVESRLGKGTIVTVEIPVQVLLAHASSF
ncbi:PAS domain S-box protein [Chloroflexota bacterium]